jgi:hypothetical protein
LIVGYAGPANKRCLGRNRVLRYNLEMGKQSLMARIDAHEIRFQCPKCGHELKQTIRRLKANEHMTCPGCSIGINIDTDRLAKATEEIQKAIEKMPPEITIKFFR